MGSDIDREFRFLVQPLFSPNWPEDGSKIYFTGGRSPNWGNTLTMYEATWSVAAPGDFNGDGMLDIEDLNRLTSEIQSGATATHFDLDQSGTVDLADRDHWVTDVKSTWIGDANLDGEFNSSDFIEVFKAGKYESGEVASWSEGDWNGDQLFDSGDFTAAFQHGGYEMGTRSAVAAVPEPSSWALLTLALVGLARIRRTTRVG